MAATVPGALRAGLPQDRGRGEASSAGSTPRSTSISKKRHWKKKPRRRVHPERAVRRRRRARSTLDLLFDDSDEPDGDVRGVTERAVRADGGEQASRVRRRRAGRRRRVRLGRDVDVPGGGRQPLGAVHALPARRHADPRAGEAGADAGREGGRRRRPAASSQEGPEPDDARARRPRARTSCATATACSRSPTPPTATRRAGARSPRPTASTTRSRCAAGAVLAIPSGGRVISGVEVKVDGAPLDADARRAHHGGARRRPPPAAGRVPVRISDAGLEHVDKSPLELGAEVEIRFAAPDGGAFARCIKGQIARRRARVRRRPS